MADENMGEVRTVVTWAEAKAQGLKRYWTGLACKHGHIAERITANGGCVSCLTEIERRYRTSHPEKFRQKWRDYERNASSDRKAKHRIADKKWRDANPEKVAERVKLWSAENNEKRLEQGRRWRSNHIEEKRAKVREWRDKNRNDPAYKTKAVERATKWAKDNPEGVRKNAHTRRARKQGAEGSHTAAELLAILKAQNWKCAEPTCWMSLRKKRHLDHITALSKGGTNYAWNLQYLCVSCNCRKHDKDPLDWARENGRLL